MIWCHFFYKFSLGELILRGWGGGVRGFAHNSRENTSFNLYKACTTRQCNLQIFTAYIRNKVGGGGDNKTVQNVAMWLYYSMEKDKVLPVYPKTTTTTTTKSNLKWSDGTGLRGDVGSEG